MKHYFAHFSLILIFIVNPAKAQHHYGILGGFGFSRLNLKSENYGFSNVGEFKSITTPTIGSFVELQIYRGFFLHSGLIFQQKGGKDKDPNNISIIELKYNSIEIPVLLKYELTLHKIQPYFMSGVSGGYIIKADAIMRSAQFKVKSNAHKIMNKTEWGFILALGFEIPVWKGQTFVECHYFGAFNRIIKHGLLSMESEQGTEILIIHPLQAEKVHILVGYSLPFN